MLPTLVLQTLLPKEWTSEFLFNSMQQNSDLVSVLLPFFVNLCEGFIEMCAWPHVSESLGRHCVNVAAKL